MIYFQCDYAEGAHPEILSRLTATNLEQTVGYGLDEHCENARQLIRKTCNAPDSDVHFFVGGTQTNATVISSILRPHQGVISCSTGHINVHESGAVEASGHKVLAIEGDNGKLTALQIENYIDAHFNDPCAEHMVQPGMVYISFPTETGTLYSKTELTDISNICRKYNIPLYADGARMGYGLMAPGNDLSLSDFAELTDIFYIGGTKIGALFGEALVINSDSLKKDFRYILKQNGGMLAKGRLLGIQFEVLFESLQDSAEYSTYENRYYKISANAVNQAMRIREAFVEAGITLHSDSSTNQQFVLLSTRQIQKLKKNYVFEIWEQLADDQYLCRFCTSWATTDDNTDKLIADILSL